jgi:hypothetical protein
MGSHERDPGLMGTAAARESSLSGATRRGRLARVERFAEQTIAQQPTI